MDNAFDRAVAIVGLGAILPDAPNVDAFWSNVLEKCYSITEVPPDRWRVADYYDPDPLAPDKTYSKIGGWVRGFTFDCKRFRIPPRVAAAMDLGQQWAVSVAEQALTDYGYPQRPLDPERTAVVIGTAMGGEMHDITTARAAFPEFAGVLRSVDEFNQLPENLQETIMNRWLAAINGYFPQITEDSMPGELPNIISGRIANVLNLRGPNFITDAACASSLAAVDTAVEMLSARKVDAVLTGGVDHNMGAATFIKFCKIGALSATGTRPFGEGADGFVMGEGAAAFLLKRLEDAERDGDKIYAVICGVGGASDGRGKGIYAPNPVGQRLAIQSAWKHAGLDPASATLIEAHGTSTRVGDVVEVESMQSMFSGAAPASIALGSVKSNFGHLKAGAGAAGLLKASLALFHKVLPPTLNARRPNPNIDFSKTPFRLNHETQEWVAPKNSTRRCGVGANGFGGTNFHVVLEEHVPGLRSQQGRLYGGYSAHRDNPEQAVFGFRADPEKPTSSILMKTENLPPVRGCLSVSGRGKRDLQEKLANVAQQAATSALAAPAAPAPEDLAAPERLVIDYGDTAELIDRIEKARRAIEMDSAQVWTALQSQGIFRGHGPKTGKLAFLFPGQGSQYLNMGRELARVSTIVSDVFAEADEIMQPILGRPLTGYIFVDTLNELALVKSENDLKQTAITQPAMLTLDIALYRLLIAYGFKPDMVMGHSLGEYAALVAAGAMPFADALEAAAARGREMSAFQVEDNGWMAAVMAPYEAVQETLGQINGYVVAANINSYHQCVIGGESAAVEQAIQAFQQKGFQAGRLPVSHAFHTKIVAPASKPLRQVLNRLRISSPEIPVVANVNGGFYPSGVEAIKDVLELQVASPVQWIKGLETLYQAGVRAFIEVGPKKALKGFVDDVLIQAHPDREPVVSLFTNHPKVGELASFNQALCGLYAAGFGRNDKSERVIINVESETIPARMAGTEKAVIAPQRITEEKMSRTNGAEKISPEDAGRLFVQALEQIAGNIQTQTGYKPGKAFDRNEPITGSIVISGTGLGLPGAEKAVMDPDNVARILRGEQFIDLIPDRFRKRMLEKRITRLIKSEDGGGRFEVISDPEDVVKLAARPGTFDLAEEYGVPEKLIEALDSTTQLAMAAGLDALREAGIPLVQTYRRATTGKYLPNKRMLPEALRDETGVIFASAFPGGNRFAEEFSRFHTWQNRCSQLAMLEDLSWYTTDASTDFEIRRRISELREMLAREPYSFDRRFLLRILAMGHSQFAEYIGARGPNTQVNSACASTATALALAEDWIRSGRCRRVIVIGGDNVTSDHLMDWVGAGFLATGAIATDDAVEEAALPFDRRRHGLIMGMGACALVVESQDAIEERGMRGIVELLSCETSNSAFHGTRLDVEHIATVMDHLVTNAECRFGLNRQALAAQTVFVSHETYTPARGGSASAEVVALRKTFGEAAGEIVVSNTKGFTGHTMGVGVEDVIAVKILEHGIVPPVPNFKEIDPELGALNLSRGGRYPVVFALHLAAGFGSQIAMTFLHRIPGKLQRVDNPLLYNRWLADISGYDQPETEVVKRVLRIKDLGAPARQPAPSGWRYGTGPAKRAPSFTDTGLAFIQPARMALPETSDQVLGASDQGLGTRENSLITSPESLVTSPESPVTSPVSPVPSPESPVTDPIKDKVLEIVGEKTGYPTDMLEIDLDLEADLGIDTVKQAETFLALREAFDIPRREDLRLRDYPTLGSVIQFVHDMKPELGGSDQGSVISDQGQGISDQGQGISDQGLGTSDQGLGSTDDLLVPSPESPITSPESPVTSPQSLVPSHETLAADPVTEKVLEIVSMKTGYPTDMLELDLDLEADLGVDTVKQAETFLALREVFDIPRQNDLKLRDYPTLAHVIKFVQDMRPGGSDQGLGISDQGLGASDQGIGKSDQGQATSDQGLGPSDGSLVTSPESRVPSLQSLVPGPESPVPGPVPLEQAGPFPRRVPVPVLQPDLDLYQPTGVALNEHSRVVVVRDQGGVGEELVARLQSLGAAVLEIRTPIEADGLEKTINEWKSAGPVQGVYWLPALDVEPTLDELDLETWHDLNRQRVKNLYLVIRALYDSIQGPENFLITATRLGGLHGYGPQPALAPLGGAVTGFAKAYKRERSEVLVKTVDFAAGESAADAIIAEKLVGETLYDPGSIEAGYYGAERYGITLVEQPADFEKTQIELDHDSVFLVTGAAGGITSLIITDLAAASGGSFYLLDLIKLPDADDPHRLLFGLDRETLKDRLIQEAKAAGERPTPSKVEKQMDLLERQEAAARAIEAVQACGGKAFYYSVDLRDGPAVAAVMEEIYQRHQRLDVIVHAAGLESSRSLPDKTPEQFDRVFDVKVDGFFNLLRAAKGKPVGATVVFSSIAGRFGNAGQTDYSAANDLLCKLTSSMKAWRPETRAIAIDWTAWSGSGMATRGSIPKIMEAAGIDMLPPEIGIPALRRELLHNTGGEVIVAGRLGFLGQTMEAESALDLEKANQRLAEHQSPRLMVGRLRGLNHATGFEVETCLHPEEQPFLYDHAMDGVPLLPGVMGIEAFAELASFAAPGYRVAGLENVLFQAPFKFYRKEPQTLYLNALVYPENAETLRAFVTLKSRRELPAVSGKENKLEAREKIHFSGEVLLARSLPEPPERPEQGTEMDGTPATAEDIYRIYFHGPSYQVLENVHVSGDRAAGLLSGHLPADTFPEDAGLLVSPRLIELCFQTAGIWEIKGKRQLALPMAVRAIQFFSSPQQPLEAVPDRPRLYAETKAVQDELAGQEENSTGSKPSQFDAQVFDEHGHIYLLISGYRTVQIPGEVSL